MAGGAQEELLHQEAMRRVRDRQELLLPFLLTVGVPLRLSKVVGALAALRRAALRLGSLGLT